MFPWLKLNADSNETSLGNQKSFIIPKNWRFPGIWLVTIGNVRNQRNFYQIYNFNQVFVERISLTIIKNVIRHYIQVSFVKFLRANLRIWLETRWNIAKSAKFLPYLQFNQVFVDRICSNLAIIKKIISHYIQVSFVKFLRANLKIWLETQWNIVKSAKFLPDLQF